MYKRQDLDAAFKDRTASGGNITLGDNNFGPTGLVDGNSGMSMKILSGDVTVNAAIQALSTPVSYTHLAITAIFPFTVFLLISCPP